MLELLPDPPPTTFSYEEVTPLLPGRAEDLMKRLGFSWPFLSTVKYQDALASKGFPPLRCAIEITSVAKARKWPFHDICQVVHNFPLPDYAPLLDVVAHVIAPILCKDQLKVLGKSLSLCFHAASEEGASNPEMYQAVITLIGLLSAALGTTRSTRAPPSGHPPTPLPPTQDKVIDMPWDRDDAQPMPAPQSDEPAPPAAPKATAKGAPPGPAPKKGKGKGKTKPPTATAPHSHCPAHEGNPSSHPLPHILCCGNGPTAETKAYHKAQPNDLPLPLHTCL